MKVVATSKPSWAVQVINESEPEDSKNRSIAVLSLDKADPGRDRIDLICTLNGEVVAVHGEVSDGLAALHPAVPQLPLGAKVVAQVVLRGASRYIDDIDITNYSAGVLQTGEMPALALLPMKNVSTFLDSEDPFDALLIPLVELQRRKRSDYANDDDMYVNFRKNAAAMALPGYTALQDCLSMITRKVGRITNLRDKPPENETLLDSYLDLAVYSILAYGLALEEADQQS